MNLLHWKKLPARALLAATLLATAGPSTAGDSWPAQSPEGLTLKKTLEHGAVYIKDGVDLGQYKSVGLLECYVQFAKDWARTFFTDLSAETGS